MGKRKKRNKSDTICIFCLARPSEEGEHVFPKSWYPSTTPPTVQRVVVPVCGICADEFEVAERKFSLPLLTMLDTANPDGASVVETLQRSWQFERAPSLKESVRRIQRHQSIMRQIKYKVRSPDNPSPWQFYVPVRSPAGLHVMAAPTLTLEHKVTAKICEKFVRGLHYHELGVPLPIETPIKVRWPDDLNPEFRAAYRQLPLNSSLAPGLRYRVIRDDKSSFWVFYLWGQIEFTAFAGKMPSERKEEPSEVDSK